MFTNIEYLHDIKGLCIASIKVKPTEQNNDSGIIFTVYDVNRENVEKRVELLLDVITEEML